MPIGSFLEGLRGGVQRGLDARQRTIDLLTQSQIRQRERGQSGGEAFNRQLQLLGIQQQGREDLAEQGFAGRRELMGEEFEARRSQAEFEADLKKQQQQRTLEAIFPQAPQQQQHRGGAAPMQVAGGMLPQARPGEGAARRAAAMGNLSQASAIMERGRLAGETSEALIPEPLISAAPGLPQALQAPKLPPKGPRDFEIFLGQWMQRRYGAAQSPESKRAILAERGMTPVEGQPQSGGMLVGAGLRLGGAPKESIDTMMERARGTPSKQEVQQARGEFTQLVRDREKFEKAQPAAQADVERRRGEARELVARMRWKREDIMARGGDEKTVEANLRDERLQLLKLQGLSDDEIAATIAPGIERTTVTKLMRDFKSYSPEGVREFMKTAAFPQLVLETGVPQGELVAILDAISKMNG